MPQFDLISNFYIISMFYILFFVFFIFCISLMNGMIKYSKSLMLIKEHKVNFDIFIKNNNLNFFKKSWNINFNFTI